ncbi:MAG TPA: UDP-N-acetylmuramoyl-tripeptide--D-alanyl-D-alanine ligase [Gemmatimonadales bacterium]
MTTWTAAAVAEALGIAAPPTAGVFSCVGTDSRAVTPAMLFVALRGDRFDGHDFLPAVRDAGAGGAVVRADTPDVSGLRLFRVADTLAALGRLAAVRRRRIAGPVVAITGTNGKTATKELAARALGSRWRVHATSGNLNNEIGVPLTLLGAPDDADALVVEAGASVPGEIARLRAVIQPTAAIVTNAGAGHLAGFGNLDAVIAEKVSLLVGAGLAVVGADPPALAARARAVADHVVVAGLDDGAERRPDHWALDADGRVEIVYRGVPFHLPLVGRHQAANAMLVLALAEALGLDLGAVAGALREVTLPPGRWEVHRAAGRTIVHDAYNANPASVQAALDTVRAISAGRPIVLLLGTMLELGDAAARAHAAAADAAMALGPALVGVVGDFAPAFARHAAALGDRLVIAVDAEALGRAVGPRLPASALVLVKASRGVRLERALPHLLASREAPCSTTS